MLRFIVQPILWVSFFTLFLSSCKEQEVTPLSDFIYASRDLKNYLSVYPVQEAIKLTNKSANGVSCAWNFGDGSTSAEQEPVISYKQSGTYTITLTTTSSTGNQATTTQTASEKVTKDNKFYNSFGAFVFEKSAEEDVDRLDGIKIENWFERK